MPKKYNTSVRSRSKTPVRNYKNYRHKYESSKYYDSDTESSNSSSTEEYTSSDSSDSENEYDNKNKKNNKKLREKRYNSREETREHFREYSRQEQPRDLKKVDKNYKKKLIDRDNEKYISRREKDDKKKSQKYDIENEYEEDNYEVSDIKKEESDYEEEKYKKERNKKNIKNEKEELETDIKTNGTPKYRVVSFNGEELTVRKMYTSNIGPKNAAQKAFNRMCDRLNEKMEITVEKVGDNKGKIMTYFFMKQELDPPVEKSIGGKKVVYRHKTVSC